tara:strand:+ start:232 stop:693 length:462 start_codon:yes stop_codon:yes gene_type:complete
VVGVSIEPVTTESRYSSEHFQAFLDSVSSLSLEHKFQEWYNVEVAAAIDGCKLRGHEINSETGESLLFLNRSAVLCVPQKGHIAHYPRHLIHCFVDDFRHNGKDENGLVMRAELFSISPAEEQLGWEIVCRSEQEVPSVQTNVSRWLRWLNNE